MTTTATGQPAAAAAGEPGTGRSRWRPRGFGPRLAGAAVSGALVALALPPYDLWPLAPVGVALLILLCRGQLGPAGCRGRPGARPGDVRAAAVLADRHRRRMPGSLVALLEASFLALAGALTPSVLRLPGWPLWVACLWVAEELARDTVPFGGLPMGTARLRRDGVRRSRRTPLWVGRRW